MPYRDGMLRPLRLLAALVLVLAPFALVGCVPDGQPEPSPTASETAVFASEEEALAAAEEVYGHYLATLDAIFEDGGENPERLLEYASPEVFEQEAPGFELFRSSELTGIGNASFTMTLQSYEPSGSVITYVCDDISGTDVVDRTGASVVPADRVSRYSNEVRIEGDPLKVVRRLPWAGTDACA